MLINKGNRKQTEIIELIDIINNISNVNGGSCLYVNFSQEYSTIQHCIEFEELKNFTNINNLFISFPVSEFGGQTDAFYGKYETIGGKHFINLGIERIHNLYIIEEVCQAFQRWVNYMPMFKNMIIDDMILPDENIKLFTMIHWKGILDGKRI
jgi:hypothetical protein